MQLSTLLHKFTALATFAAAALVAGPALAAPALKIGVVPGIFADSVEVAAKEAKKQGLDVQVVEFTDWATPNVALDAGEVLAQLKVEHAASLCTGGSSGTQYVRLWPHTHQVDGFFAAVWQRT